MSVVCKLACLLLFLVASTCSTAGQQAVRHRHVLGADLDSATLLPILNRLGDAWRIETALTKLKLQLWANQESILEGFLWWRKQQLQGARSVSDVTPPSYRIVGGRAVQDKAKFSYVASLRDRAGKHVCGGTLITSQAVLTAAHCLDRVQIYSVQLGWNTSQGKCSETRVHPDWSEETQLGDIGLCILDEDVLDVQPVWLPRGPLNIPQNSIPLTVVGLGATSEGGSKANELQSVEVYNQGLDSCQVPYKHIKESQICAGLPEGGKDACQGDSGGPLLLLPSPASSNTEDVQVGVVSYGRGCARAGYPGVYTNVASYWSWIEEQLQASNRPSVMPNTTGYINFNASNAQPISRPDQPVPPPENLFGGLGSLAGLGNNSQPISSPEPPVPPPASVFGGLGFLGGLGNIFQNLGSIVQHK